MTSPTTATASPTAVTTPATASATVPVTSDTSRRRHKSISRSLAAVLGRPQCPDDNETAAPDRNT